MSSIQVAQSREERIRAASQVARLEDFKAKPRGRVTSARSFYRTTARIKIAEWGGNRLWLTKEDGALMLEGTNELVYEVVCAYDKMLEMFVARGYTLPAPR